MLKALFYHLTRSFLIIYFKIFNRLSVRGREELARSAEGGRAVILAANHASYLDPPLIGAIYPGRLRFVAWDGLFKSRLFGAIIKTLGAVPVSQENRSSAAGLLKQVMGFLNDGSSVLIFPEGKRSLDGKLQPLEGGTALLASKTGSPIVPVWIKGTFDSLPPQRSWPRPSKIVVTFGDPISPDELDPALSEKERRAELMSALSAAYEKMSGES